MSVTNGSKHFDDILFTGLLEHRSSKIIGIIISIFLTILTCFSAYSIIWFERFGSDLKRIFINKTVSFICWRILLYFGVIQATDWTLYFYQPLPEWFCFFHLIFRNAIVFQVTFSSTICKQLFPKRVRRSKIQRPTAKKVGNFSSQ